MISKTSVYLVGNSIAVRIPSEFVKHLKINKNEAPKSCNIEELNDNELKISFA